MGEGRRTKGRPGDRLGLVTLRLFRMGSDMIARKIARRTLQV